MAYCEIDPYCQGVLLSRISDGKLSSAPIWDDIKSLRSSMLPAKPDIIYGGFPCQDISVAGKGKGLEGERSGLFFEIMRLAEEIKPSFIFLENVPAITARGGLRVVREIAERGYDCRWCTLSAASVGAMHKRERWFLLAHSLHDGSSSKRKVSGRLNEQVVYPQMWPTPRANNKMDCPSERRRDNPQLETIVNINQSTFGKKLCPRWVSVLMGYPTTHTDLEPSVMQWFLSRQKRRLKN
jgi:site-specific DNA-cytosine methylase